MRTKTLTAIILFLVFGYLTGCNHENKKAAANKAIVQQAFDTMNNQDFEGLRELLAETYERHCQATPEVEIKDVGSFIALVKEWYTTFPDAVQTVHMLTAEGDKVAFYATFEGTHQAPMNGIPATGKRIVSEAFGFHRLENGKIVETWVTWDNLAILTQLGIFPPPTKEEQ